MPEPSEPEPPRDRRTIVPFLGALAIIVIAVVAVWFLNLSDDDGESEEQRVVHAAIAQNAAMQRNSFEDYREFTCAAELGNESDFLDRQRDLSLKHGARYVDDVTGVVIKGDHATAEVIYRFEKESAAPSGADVTFVHEDGAWKVC